MPILTEGNLTFQFENSWHVEKFDESSFHRNQFQNVCGGSKAVDFLALAPDLSAWFIEVKDFRVHRREKTIDLAKEIAGKVRDSLAAVLPASINANDAGEKGFATKALTSRSIKVVFHLEQPTKHSKLFPRAINPADVRQTLKQLLKPIDAHPKVVEMTRMGSIPWTVN